VTNGEMKAEVMAAFGLQSITDYNEKDYVQKLLNRGVVDVLSRTRCTVRCTKLHLDPGVSDYMLDHKILSIVDFGQDSDRAPRNGTHWHPSFTLIRSDLLQVWPEPSDSITMNVWAVRAPNNPLVEDDHDPANADYGAIPPEFHDAILMYAKWWAADFADDSGSQNGERYKQQYDVRIREIKSLVNKRGTARAPRSRSRNLRRVSPRSAWVD
jgi:hypothetical protein